MRGLPVILFNLLPLAAAARAASPPDFARDIQPIFQKRCYVCHGPQMQMKGLRFDERQAAMRAITPGDSAHSAVITMTTGAAGKLMPPSGPLPAGEIALLREWIDRGANWPDSAARPGLWSLQPIARPAPPVRNDAWISSAIDRFVLARLEAEKIEPSPPADRVTLIRRISLDLTGLPPAPRDVENFLADDRPDAYERLVDRLLASPHYGEKWARYWLDLAHYADSDGYEKDLERPWAWRYRKWVIDALNRDMPYDQFTIEQIAGDELPHSTLEQKIATGFFRSTLTNREGGVDRREARFDELIDRTGTLGTVWLGMTMRCAQCHDHKYDPIKQKDFYQILAYFNRAIEADIDAPMPGEIEPHLAAKPEYDRKRAELLSENDVPALQGQWESKMRGAMDDPGKELDWDFAVTAFRASFDHADPVMRKPAEERTDREQHRLTDYFVRNPGPVIAKQKEVTEKFKTLRMRLDELEKGFPGVTQAYIFEDDRQARPAHIAVRGDWRTEGAEVEPCTPSFLGKSGTCPTTRLELAKWLVSPGNPLVARVAVNRLWQELFGRGLVATSDDFGTQGERPSHPELLDYLASDFRDHGWSMKRTLRQIALSATYRQSSAARPDLESKDPANILLARQLRLRLPAELIRDQALATSGLLDAEIGGKSIKPPQPAGVAELGYRSNVKWQESTGKARYRRGLYIHYQRTTPHPFLANFDEPDSTLSCTRRRISDTPLQSLNLLNDPVFFEAAGALARRIQQEAPGSSVDDRLTYAFELCLGRKPTAVEKDRLATYFHQQQDWVGVSRILLNLDEFITRE
jgi:hypothetical protein